APLELQRIGVLPKPPNPIIFGESRQADSRPRFPQCGARGMEPRKFDDFTVRQVAEMLGVTRQVVMLWCRTRGWGYRLSPTTPLADSSGAPRAYSCRARRSSAGLIVTPDTNNSRQQKMPRRSGAKLKESSNAPDTRARVRVQ